MSTVSLVEIWLNQAADPSVRRAFAAPEPFTWGRESTVRQQRTAAGTLRMIRSTTPGARSTTLTLRWLGREDVSWLVDNAETLFCYRDPYGRKVFGWWSPPDVGEHEWVDDRANVSLVFHEATFDESV